MTVQENWIRLDADVFNQPRITQLNGVDVKVMVAAQDVPSAVRGNYNKSTGRFLIEFRYVNDDEPFHEVLTDSSIRIFIGKSSSRIRQIELDLSTVEQKSVGLTVGVRREVSKKIIDAINQLSDARKESRRDGNYEITREVIADDALFAKLSLAS